MTSLFKELRSEQNLFAAWRHVKKSALNSQNSDIRGAASEFEHEHQKHIRRIITQLRENRFEFDAVTGVLKDARKRIAVGKNPRPIAIATIKNRVVQRAILQVLQPRTAIDPKDANTKYRVQADPRLGKINDVNRSRFGVGGLIHPYGGVEPAIRLIMEAINSGAKFFYQSDIEAFFTRIPTKEVVKFVFEQTMDSKLAELFERALVVEVQNKDKLGTYASLFPSGGIGVAQGSSLSAFAGNVLLYELDHQLNGMGVTAVRYIDDILMVAPDEKDLAEARKHAEVTLHSFGFGLYKPAKGSDKAAQGECKNSIKFLGCTIQPNRCVPSSASIDKVKDDVRRRLSDSKIAIRAFVNSGKPLSSKQSRTATLDVIGKRLYGWQKAFSFCTDAQPFAHLDKFVSSQVHDYEKSVLRLLSHASPETLAAVLGIPSTLEMFEGDKKRHSRLLAKAISSRPTN